MEVVRNCHHFKLRASEPIPMWMPPPAVIREGVEEKQMDEEEMEGGTGKGREGGRKGERPKDEEDEEGKEAMNERVVGEARVRSFRLEKIGGHPVAMEELQRA